jgi:DNA replication and repair protein RecF
LLDDITSELDNKRQTVFFQYLNERQGQVFITTTDSAPLLTEKMPQAKFFCIEKGNIA